MARTTLSLAMLATALTTGCNSDFTILDDVDVVGVANPPNLQTPSKEDQILQVTTPQVDILWVIDNSGSMFEEQQKLKDNFNSFMEYFLDSGLDYHIGAVSTDTDGNDAGKLAQAGGSRYVTPDTPNPVETFRQMASFGTNGSADERGRRAAFKALNDPLLNGYNSGFYRDDASLHIIVISDEHDYSNNDPTINEFVNWMNALKPDPEMATFSGIIGPRGGCVTAEDGSEYRSVIQQVGGIEESICRDDWAPVLEQLGLQAAGLRREYFLSEVPVPGTVKVWVEQGGFVYDGVDEALLEGSADIGDFCETSCFQFVYDGFRNSIVMTDFIPEPLAKVHIKYDLLSGWEPNEDVE
jgi:hypothetical protein